MTPVENTMSKFILPAEWSRHKATWLGWPHNRSDWPGKFAPIPWVYAEMVKKIAEGEEVNVIVQSVKSAAEAQQILLSAGVNMSGVRFRDQETNRGWLRDSAPLFVKSRNAISLLDFRFNAWAKYRNYKKDNEIAQLVGKVTGYEIVQAVHKGRQVVLEGGAVDSNGKGTLITTEECLLDQRVQVRNKNFTKADYESVFKEYLGISNVIWLGKGIEGDDTHGHVDDLCRFVNDRTLLIVVPDDPSILRYRELNENYERLQDASLEDGSKPELVKLPLPDPVVFKGQILPASYANFYISNSYVLVPTFNDPKDRVALNIISEFFPDRKTAGIHAADLVWGLGTIHCLTHEEPAA